MYALFVSLFSPFSWSLSYTHTPTHTHKHTRLTLFAFAYTQSQITGLNCYHMVTIARAPNRSKTSPTTEKWETGARGGERSHGVKEEDNTRDKERGKGHLLCRSHLYMRSMSISGSSWNSLIFTVSDRILFRFLRSSSTLKTQEGWHMSKVTQQRCASLCVSELFYTWEGNWVFCISVSSSA